MYLLACAAVLKVKEAFLQDGGYRIISRLAGRDEMTPGWLDRVQFFSLDILLVLGAGPVLLLCLARWGHRKALSRTVLLVSLGLIGVSFVNANALGTTGKFLSADQLAPMFNWVWERPATLFEYVSPGALLRLFVFGAAIGLLYRFRTARLFSAFTPGALMLGLAVAALDLLALYAIHARSRPATSFDTPILVQMARSLAPPTTVISVADRMQATERLALRCEPNAAQAPGSAKRNFLLFIMETVPYELFARARGTAFGNIEDMQRSGYTAVNHYSTYPFTSYARFSIFTGLYPSYRLEKTLPLTMQRPYRSVFASLVDDGYDFKVFDPVSARYEVDDWLVQQMGGTVLSTGAGDSVAEKDGLVLDKLVGAIAGAAASGKPFVYAFLPQLTHGPWLPAGATKEELYGEGIERLADIDKSLGAIVSTLKQNGVYDNTVIVLTADHGLRTKTEAAFLKTLVLNDASYHVPMVIHDPLMKRRVTIDSISSHLDISPTLHCLYRTDAPSIETQGQVMTAAAKTPRTLFFGGAWYNGSDGMWNGVEFYSYNRQLDLMWRSASFDFDESRPAPAASASTATAGIFDHHRNLQEALLRN